MKILFLAVLGFVVLAAGIRYLERKSIFFPMRDMENTPSEVGLDYEDMWFFSSDNKKINAWVIPSEGARHTILFSHGNAGNISHRLDKIVMMNGLGLNVFIFDYRGYGKSEGVPSERGLYRDARAAYKCLMESKGIVPGHIVLYGESIGGAVAVELAASEKVGALITEEAFTSVKDMAQMAFPLVPSFILSSKFDSLAKIGNITCPKLIIHSPDDEIVPFSQGERLFAAAGDPKTFLKLRGGHNTAFWDSAEKYKEGIKSFTQGLSEKNKGYSIDAKRDL